MITRLSQRESLKHLALQTKSIFFLKWENKKTVLIKKKKTWLHPFGPKQQPLSHTVMSQTPNNRLCMTKAQQSCLARRRKGGLVSRSQILVWPRGQQIHIFVCHGLGYKHQGPSAFFHLALLSHVSAFPQAWIHPAETGSYLLAIFSPPTQ